MNLKDKVDMAAGVVAVVAFVFAIWQWLMERWRQRAEQLREQLQRAADASDRLPRLLAEENPLIDASWAIAIQLRSQLDGARTREAFWSQLSDGGRGLMGAIAGWNASPQSTRLSQLIERLQDVSAAMAGLLGVISKAISTLILTTRLTCSPMFFYEKLLPLEARPTLPFFEDHKNEPDVDKLTVALALSLMGDSSMYANLHQKYVGFIAQFIKELAESLRNLSDRKLARLSKARPKRRNVSHFSGDVAGQRETELQRLIKALKPLEDDLEPLRQTLTGGTFNHLSDLLNLHYS